MSIEAFFTSKHALKRIRGGSLGHYMDTFATLLLEQGYARSTAQQIISLVANFSRWLYSMYLDAKDVNGKQIQRYLRYRRRKQRVDDWESVALHKMFGLLVTKGVACSDSVAVSTTLKDRALLNYTQYLSKTCGYSPTTQRIYCLVVSEFITAQFGEDDIDFSSLSSTHITQFVQHKAYQYSQSRVSLMIKALRSFLRYLSYRGEIAINLVDCVPAVANWSLADLPHYLRKDEVQSVLDHCDRRTAMGRRDYAVLILLARLGLRACEIVSLQLDDIAWEQGYLTICRKGGRQSQLPLLADAGEALADYLYHGRPQCTDRHVFIRTHAPISGFKSSCSISSLVARAFARSGIDYSHGKAHLFRHALATDMLQQGASLQEIAEVLGHRQINTTRIYAKVDLPALRELSIPWPGGDL